MAIWADRAQILNRIYKIAFADLRQGLDVMNVYESIRERSIYCSEVEVACCACGAMSSDAELSRSGIAFISVDMSQSDRALRETIIWRHFAGLNIETA